MIHHLIDRYKRLRTEHFLRRSFPGSYAFVGMGQHSLTNLYPILQYLGVRLKYICVTSELKAQLIQQRFPQTQACTSLTEILADESVCGVFVAASPASHYSIARQVLQSGKSLFIEKPPCQTLEELEDLISQQHLHHSPVVVVGLQKRYAPAVKMLHRRLQHEHIISYDLHHRLGTSPEGNAPTDLFIQPLDLAIFLFGRAELIAKSPLPGGSFILMLRHQHIVGTLELSTSYSWSQADESLVINTLSGIYRLANSEVLTYAPKAPTILGIPIEKIRRRPLTTTTLAASNRCVPTATNNPLFTQGYYAELLHFLQATQQPSPHASPTSLESLRDTYHLIGQLADSART